MTDDNAESQQPSPAGGETPLDYLLRVMRDPLVSSRRRDAMARSTLAWLHTRPKQTGADEADSEVLRRMEDATASLARKLELLASGGK